MNKKRIGIALDEYKVKEFKKRLKKEGYTVKVKPGIVPGTKMFRIDVESPEDVKKLTEVVKELNAFFNRRN